MLMVLLLPAAVSAQELDSLQTRVWLDRGDDPVVQRGDEVRVYYRTSEDAYAAIFRIDTDGVISLVFPQHPDADPFVTGARDFRLMFPDTPRWRVEEDPGAGYFFMVASPEPLDFSSFGFDVERGWDLSGVGAVVYEDPYVAIDDYVASIVRDWDVVPYALDFLSYSVGEAQTYPRFLCYDCHDFERYSSWNPYANACTTYQVVIWDDPYFYPRYRYSGTRIVVARALGPRPRYGVAPRGVATGWRPIVRTRSAPPRRLVEYKEEAAGPTFAPRNPVSRPSRAVPAPVGATRRPATAPEDIQPARTQVQERVPTRDPRPTLQRRSPPTATSPRASSTLPARAPARAPSRAVAPSRTTPSAAARPTPQRAPVRAVPSPGARRSAPPAARPPSQTRTGARSAPSARPAVRSAPRPAVRPSTQRPTGRGSVRPVRRPGGRGG